MAKTGRPEKTEPDDMQGYQRIQSPDQLNDDGVQMLIEAICVRAADDWRLGKLKERTYGHKSSMVAETERFFRSGWFEMLTGLDGKAVLERLGETL